MKILFLDIETAPNLVTVWGLWQQNVAINQILDSGYVMCWSAKWADESQISFDSVFQSDPMVMLLGIHRLLNEADVVVHYNGSKFDIPTLNKEFIKHGLKPPAPYKQVDLLRTARNVFKFPSNKLDYIAQELGLGKKTPHIGHQLWLDCMNLQEDAWKMMEEYNKNDVILLERLYDVFLPWIKPHPNFTLYTEDNSLMCPVCGSKKFVKRGFAYTAVGKYQRYRCACGSWFKDGKTLGHKQTVLV